MRLASFVPLLVPFLFSLVALILSLLCVFAGSKRGYIEHADLLTLNTSMLGHLTLSAPKTSSTFLNNLGGNINGDINGLITDFAKTLKIHDFYSAHILDYCEGFYTPSPVANKTMHPKKNVTHCSNSTWLFHFDPTSVIQTELMPGLKLADLKWPSAIKDAARAVGSASKVMFVLYCIGITTTGLALTGALVGIVRAGRLIAILNIVVGLLAFVSLGIAAAIATTIAVKVVNAVNKYGDEVGVAAYKGNTFLGMTWAATILMFLASLAHFHEFIRGRKRLMRNGEKSGF